MIRFESSVASATRNAPSATKVTPVSLATTEIAALEAGPEGLFSSEGAAFSEEQGPEAKKARGRSKKFRS